MALFFSTWWLDIFMILVGFALYLFNYFQKAYSYWENRGVPFLKPTVPFGNVKNIFTYKKSSSKEYQTFYNELEGHRFGGFYMITDPRLLIRDPNLIKEILVKDFAYFHDKGFIVDEKRRVWTSYLLFLSGKRWKNVRTKLTPAFTSGKVKMMFPIFVDCAREMNKILKEAIKNKNENLDVKELIGQYTTDVIGSTAFGLELNTLNEPDSEFIKMGRKFFESHSLNTVTILFRKSFPNITLWLAPFIDDIPTFFMTLVKDVVKFREENDIKRNDFLQLLIQLKNNEKLEYNADEKEDYYLLKGNEKYLSEENYIELTDGLLAAQCLGFFTAGFETSALTASYCLYELALNPDIQDRLRNEMDAVLETHERKITYESIQEMKYLGQVIDESLRKYPPVAVFNRECTIPYKISGTDVTIEKGILLAIPVYAIHHDPKYYPDPEKFDPERFSYKNKTNITPFTYLPFGEGPRICIGMRLALFQIKVAVAAVLSEYTVSVCEKTEIPLTFDPKRAALTAKGGIWLNIKQR